MWEEKAKALVEEHAKQRSALETELRTLKAAQEDIAARFNESLLALQTVRSPSCWHIFSHLTCLARRASPEVVHTMLTQTHPAPSISKVLMVSCTMP